MDTEKDNTVKYEFSKSCSYINLIYLSSVAGVFILRFGNDHLHIRHRRSARNRHWTPLQKREVTEELARHEHIFIFENMT